MIGGNFVHLIESGAKLRDLVARQRLLRQRDAILFGQLFQGFPKGKALDHHDEVEHVAFGIAAKTFEELMIGVDGKRRRLLVVERAKAGIAIANATQSHVVANHRGDVYLRFEMYSETIGI